MRRPAKLAEGHAHPDTIVESALLACVSPPDITYQHHLQAGQFSESSKLCVPLHKLILT
jgi:hypothetical protein